jgi:hypothetical protein
VSVEYALSRIGEEPVLLALYSYWDSVRSGKEMPDRTDIDPIDMPRFILPHLAMTDVDDGMRFKVRLVGTEIVRHHRRDTTGKFAAEYMEGAYLEYITSLYVELRASRRPVFSESIFRHVDTNFKTSRLILPLTHGGSAVGIAFMGQIFQPLDAYPGAPLTVPLDVGSLEIVSRITLPSET